MIVTSGEVNGRTRNLGVVTEASLGLFTEKDQQLVATATVDRDGRYRFVAVPEGEYRLVVHAEPLCVANVPLRIERTKRCREKRKANSCSCASGRA